MSNLRPSRRPAEAGYSLAEALVVLAIVGMISVVSIPQFLNFYRQNRLKTSLREFTTVVRAARQRAVSRNEMTKVSFSLDATRGAYQMYDGTTDPVTKVTTWTPVFTDATAGTVGRQMEETVRFYNSAALPTFADVDSTPDGLQDIIFLPNGTAQTEGSAYLRFGSTFDSGSLAITQFEAHVYTSGMLKVTPSKVTY